MPISFASPRETSQAKRFPKALAIFLAIHFLMHINGAAGGARLNWLTQNGTAISIYGRLTGCGTQFGFFAPRPGSPTRARTAMRVGGKWSPMEELQMNSGEGQMRLKGLISLIRDEQQPDKPRTLAASIAAARPDLHPEAEAICVTFEALIIPQITEQLQNPDSNT